jgi:hypothetical protein
LASLVLWAWWPGAVLALIDGLAIVALGVVGNVLLARRVGDALIVGESVDTSGVSTFARSTSTAVDDNLSAEANGRGVVVLEEDVESISKCRGRSLSPAGAAVDRDVLVLAP